MRCPGYILNTLYVLNQRYMEGCQWKCAFSVTENKFDENSHEVNSKGEIKHQLEISSIISEHISCSASHIVCGIIFVYEKSIFMLILNKFHTIFHLHYRLWANFAHCPSVSTVDSGQILPNVHTSFTNQSLLIILNTFLVI